MSYYGFFFAKGTQTVLAKSKQLVRERVKQKKVEHVKSFSGEKKYVECYDAKRKSPGYLVELLVSLDLSPDDIMAYQNPLPWWSMKTNMDGRSTGDNNDQFAVSEGSSTSSN